MLRFPGTVDVCRCAGCHRSGHTGALVTAIRAPAGPPGGPRPDVAS